MGADASVKVLKIILIISGSLSLFLGILGIFLPLLPTTPFLLLSAACYAKSSKSFYDKLLGNRILGPYIKNYRVNKSIPLNVKISSISLLWLTITVSIVFFSKNIIISIILLIVAVSVTAHILSFKTSKLK